MGVTLKGAQEHETFSVAIDQLIVLKLVQMTVACLF